MGKSAPPGQRSPAVHAIYVSRARILFQEKMETKESGRHGNAGVDAGARVFTMNRTNRMNKKCPANDYFPRFS
jgi:hypothetical protein